MAAGMELQPDPHTTAALRALARYRRMMRWMLLAMVVVIVGAARAVYRGKGVGVIHLYIALAVGVAGAMLLVAAVMGLALLSATARRGREDAED
jgi:hypothetical protein